MYSQTEENYLKALYMITSTKTDKEAGTNEIAAHLQVTPASVNDMLKKLTAKRLIDYQKYGKATLTDSGKKSAIDIIRKHRLWETFLFEKLGFSWDEIHEVAEQLEHIQSKKLIEKLDKFLNFPTVDPHGDAIPDAQGNIKETIRKKLSEIEPGTHCRLIAVKDNSAPFLQYLLKLGLGISTPFTLENYQVFDDTFEISTATKTFQVGRKFAENVFVERI